MATKKILSTNPPHQETGKAVITSSLPDLKQKKLNIEMIALDLDDTLLTDQLTISDYTVKTLQQAAQRGIYLTICSGRPEEAIAPYAKRLGLTKTEEGRFVIAQNGASILDLHTRKKLYSRIVEPDILIHAYRMATKEGLACEVCNSSTIVASRDNSWIQLDLKLSGLTLQLVADYENHLLKKHSKMIIPGDPKILRKLEKQLKAEFGNKCVIFISKPYFLEILPANTGKGEALKWLTRYLNLSQDNIMAFGDSMNDETMMRMTTHSVAMANGLPEIQAIARYTTKYTNNHDGLARFVQKFVL